MDEQEVLEQEEEVTTTTTEPQSAPTQEVPTQAQELEEEPTSPLVYDPMPNNSENIIHQLFYSLGVDVDYVPQNKNECFTMGCQLICALFFISWFLKMLFSTVRSVYKS